MPAETPAPRSAGIVVLATIGIVAALYFGRDFFIPIALSLLFTALLRPLVRRFERAGLSAPIGASTVLVVFLGLLAAGGLVLADPVRSWMADAPGTLASAEQRLQKLRRPLQALTEAAQKVERSAGAGGPEGQQATPVAPAAGPNLAGLAARVFGTTTSLVGGLVEVVLLTFLLLASGDVFLKKLIKILPVRRERQEAIEIANETETVVAHYMVATALINAGQGAVVALTMWLLHVPNPLLWGILTFFLEFIPYLGAAGMLILLTLTGLATFDSVGHALLPPAAYLAISTIQNNLVSPVAYGRRLRLNPVAVLVGVLFWWYLWGVPGAFLAVPIIATFKILGEHLDSLAPVAEFLGA
jgi:predicted PurR-regulated permease PerM